MISAKKRLLNIFLLALILTFPYTYIKTLVEGSGTPPAGENGMLSSSLLSRRDFTPYVDPELEKAKDLTRVILVVDENANINCLAEKMISCRVTPSFGGVKLVLGAIKAENIGILASNSGTLAVLKDRELQFLNSKLPHGSREELLNALRCKVGFNLEIVENVQKESKPSGNVTMRDVVKIMNASAVWTDFGVTGDEVTLAIVDTGVDYGALSLGYWDVIARDNLGLPAAFDADAMGIAYTNITLTAFQNASGTFIPTSGLNPFVYVPLLILYGYLPVIRFSALYGEPFPTDMDVTGILGDGETCHWGVMFQWIFGLDLFPTIVVDSDADGVCESVYVDMSFDWCWIPYWYNMTYNEVWPFWAAPWPPDFSFSDESALNVNFPVGARDFTGDGIYDLSLGSLAHSLDIWGMAPNYLERGLVLKPVDPHGNYVCFVYDFDGHGTSCASLAAGRDLGHLLFGNGIAYNSKIMGITALFIGDVIEGELWAAGFDLIPKTKGWTEVPGYGTVYGVWHYIGAHKADIISNSWGWSGWALGHWTTNTPWFDVLAALEDALTIPGYLDPNYPGTVVVHAAGNGGPGYGTVTEPAYSALTISVGASTSMNWTMYEFGFAGGYYDDVISWSARGPTTFGAVKPDVVGVGAFAYAATAVFRGLGEGSNAFWLFGGTSMSTPVVAGAAALVQEGFRRSYGVKPTPEFVKLALKSTAVDLGYNSFVQGAGRVDCYTAVSLAMRNRGVTVSSSATWDNIYNLVSAQWEASHHLLGQLPPSAPSPPIYDTCWFAGVVRQGETSTAEFKVANPTGENLIANVNCVVHKQIGKTMVMEGLTQIMPEDWALFEWDWGSLTVFAEDAIPEDAELMTVSLVVPYEYFDPDGDYSWNLRWGIIVLDWEDTNGDGVVNVDEVWQISYGYNTGTSNEVTIGYPNLKFKHKPVFFVYQRNFTVPQNPTPFKIYIKFYDRTLWDWADLTQTTLNIPANSEISFNATLTVPSNAWQGVYEGQILVEVVRPYRRTIAVPVSIFVPATLSEGELIYKISQPEITTPYNPYIVGGYFDWRWRYESGDWKNWLFEITDQAAVAAFVYADWTGSKTDADMFSISPEGIFEDCTGNYWIQDGIFSWHTRTGSSEEYVMLYNDLTAAKFHTVLLHNVLFDGGVFPENVSCTVKVIRVEPAPPAKMLIEPEKSGSQTFSLETGNKLTNISLTAVSPFQVQIEPNYIAEIPELGSYSFKVTVYVPANTLAGTYMTYVKLCANEFPEGFYIPLWMEITVPAVKIVNLKLDVGRVHFPGEIAQFYILTMVEGSPINLIEYVQLKLWCKAANGTYYKVTPNGNLETIDVGLHGFSFLVPADAVSCILFAGIETYIEENNTLYRGASIVSFDVSTLLTNWNARLEAITGNVTLIKTDVGIVKINTELLNASLVGLSEKEAQINTTLGLVKADLNAINLVVEAIKGDIAHIKTDLGDLKGTVVEIQDGVATIETHLGTVKAKVENLPSEVSGGVSGDIRTVVALASASLIVGIVGLCTLILLFRKKRAATGTA
ncbi:MAG: S8 family serine peptidase [Candidatus Bathyarchaeia archaeon]